MTPYSNTPQQYNVISQHNVASSNLFQQMKSGITAKDVDLKMKICATTCYCKNEWLQFFMFKYPPTRLAGFCLPCQNLLHIPSVSGPTQNYSFCNKIPTYPKFTKISSIQCGKPNLAHAIKSQQNNCTQLGTKP